MSETMGRVGNAGPSTVAQEIRGGEGTRKGRDFAIVSCRCKILIRPLPLLPLVPFFCFITALSHHPLPILASKSHRDPSAPNPQREVIFIKTRRMLAEM